MRLSEHFTLEELTRTDTRLPNDPDAAHGENLVRLCDQVLEPARALVGPLHVNSGFRTLAVNTKIGGAGSKPGQKPSQHLRGQAADVVPTQGSLEGAFQAIKASDIPFDQLIIEPTWLHLSVADLGAKPRRQTLRAHRVGGEMVYELA